MATIVADRAGSAPQTRLNAPAARYGWLAIGSVCAMLSCGGRWDIALAAWLAPIFLLRFSRTSTPVVAAVGLLLASLAANLAYCLLTAIPFNPMTIVLCLLVTVTGAVPALLDRLIAIRLPAVARLLMFPAAAAVTEFAVGSVLPMGAAIGVRAITQGENLALLQVTAITGPYGIAFLIGWTATVVNALWETPTQRALLRVGAPLAVALTLVLMAGQARLALAPMATTTVKVAAISPDLRLRQSSDALLAGGGDRQTLPLRTVHAAIADALLAQTRAAAAAGARIVAWSETAAPSLEEDKPALLARIGAAARQSRVYVNATVGVARARNETFLFGPDGRLLWHYRKNHPVPGMEPVPPFANAVPVVATPYGRLSNLICFDGDFPALARVDANLMLEPSWDWPEVAYAHTFRMLRLRAIENGYALARPVFNGITGAFDRYGRTLATRETMAGGSRIVLADMPVQGGRTIYNRIGDVFAWLCALGLAACFVLALRSRRDRGNEAALQRS